MTPRILPQATPERLTLSTSKELASYSLEGLALGTLQGLVQMKIGNQAKSLRLFQALVLEEPCIGILVKDP